MNNGSKKVFVGISTVLLLLSAILQWQSGSAQRAFDRQQDLISQHKILKESTSVRNYLSPSLERQVAEWNQTYGGTRIDEAWAVQQTSDGGYVIGGTTWSFGAGDGDFWIVKIDSTGALQWNKTYGGPSSDEAHSIRQTSDGGYIVAGWTYSFGAGSGLQDIWVVKIDHLGNHQWNNTFGGIGSDMASSVRQSSDGGFIIAGTTDSFGKGEGDVWLIKTNSVGTQQWNRTYGGTQQEGASSIEPTANGGYIIAGTTTSYGSGLTDFWLVKVDSAGNEQWNRAFGGTSNERAYSVAGANDGGYVVAGETSSFGEGETDIWLVKTDLVGNQKWNRTYGGTNYDGAYSVAQTIDEGYVISGYSGSFSVGETDVWVIKTNSDGSMQWSNNYGGADYDHAFSIVQTADEGYIVAGQTESFGAGEYDFWIIKLPMIQAETFPTYIMPYVILGAILAVAATLSVYFTKIRKHAPKSHE